MDEEEEGGEIQIVDMRGEGSSNGGRQQAGPVRSSGQAVTGGGTATTARAAAAAGVTSGGSGRGGGVKAGGAAMQGTAAAGGGVGSGSKLHQLPGRSQGRNAAAVAAAEAAARRAAEGAAAGEAAAAAPPGLGYRKGQSSVSGAAGSTGRGPIKSSNSKGRPAANASEGGFRARGGEAVIDLTSLEEEEEGGVVQDRGGMGTWRRHEWCKRAGCSCCPPVGGLDGEAAGANGGKGWVCLVCTLVNKPSVLQCEACLEVRPHESGQLV